MQQTLKDWDQIGKDRAEVKGAEQEGVCETVVKQAMGHVNVLKNATKPSPVSALGL